MANKQALKQRIKSISTTKKITGAMEMIANSKLTKLKNKAEEGRTYTDTLKEIVSDIMASNPHLDNKFFKKNNSSESVTIVFCSDIGMCGGYNAHVLDLIKKEVDKSSKILLVGTKLDSDLVKEGYKFLKEPIEGESIDFETIKHIGRTVTKMYVKGQIGRIDVVYTEFINTLTFKPVKETVLPYSPDKATKKKSNVETIFEPSADVIIDNIIPLMVDNYLYSVAQRSKVSEYASRRAAMENATDNAEELVEDLTLKYNQARQQSITQEITEIVAGADAI